MLSLLLGWASSLVSLTQHASQELKQRLAGGEDEKKKKKGSRDSLLSLAAVSRLPGIQLVAAPATLGARSSQSLCSPLVSFFQRMLLLSFRLCTGTAEGNRIEPLQEFLFNLLPASSRSKVHEVTEDGRTQISFSKLFNWSEKHNRTARLHAWRCFVRC